YAQSVISNPNVPGSPTFPLTSGFRIIGLLSTPKFDPPLGPLSGGPFMSNYVIAYVRAFSGSASEKPPQEYEVRRDLAFEYRMIGENDNYVPYDPTSVVLPGQTNVVNTLILRNALAFSRDVRLTFRWPVLPNNDTGNERQTFRVFTGGRMIFSQGD